MVPVFSSSNHDAEQEALAIHGLLEAAGLPSLVVGPSAPVRFLKSVKRDAITSRQSAARTRALRGRRCSPERSPRRCG